MIVSYRLASRQELAQGSRPRTITWPQAASQCHRPDAHGLMLDVTQTLTVSAVFSFCTLQQVTSLILLGRMMSPL